MSVRQIIRSVRIHCGDFVPKKRKVCPLCYTATYITKYGLWYRHRMPPNAPFGLPQLAGPVCKNSGKKATP